MKYVSMFIGAMITGALVFGIWPEMWKTYGIMGGWLAAVIIIGLCWFMNHWLGLFSNPDRGIWIDQGMPIAAAGIAWAMVRFGADFTHCLPTFCFLTIGGILGGVAAYFVKQHNPNFRSQNHDDKNSIIQS